MTEPARQEILKMNLEGLRPYVQARLELDEWPGDWPAAGLILEQSYFNFQRAKSGQQLFGITLFGERATGSGIDENALVAIFRAFLLMHQEDDELRGVGRV